MKTIETNLGSALRAGYTFFYAQTNEMDRTIDNIKAEIVAVNESGKGDWKIKVADFESMKGDPDEAMNILKESEPYMALIVKNLNWFMQTPNGELNYEMVQFFQNRFEEFSSKDGRKAIIIASNEQFNNAIPAALRKEFMTIDFPLPDKKEVKEILNNIVEAVKDSDKFQMPSDSIIDDLVEGALGLTKRGCQNAYAYSLIEGAGSLDPKIVSAIRSAEINETAGLSVGQYDVGDILGYENAKNYIRQAINNPDSRGVLLLGPPGVGKTHLAKWTSTVSSKILIEFELAGVQGEGLYGQAENAMAEALRVVRSISNCVLFLDEIEKAIPSKSSTNDTTGTRSFSQLLKFLSDSRPEGCFVIATCNDISKLPPEWVRSERFDVIFFADLPSDIEKQAIYNHYLDHYKVKPGNLDIDCMEEWTGAEIKTACRLAKVMSVNCDQAAEFVVPIARTMSDDITYLRKWSKGRSVPATKPGKTLKTKAQKTPKRIKRSVDM